MRLQQCLQDGLRNFCALANGEEQFGGLQKKEVKS